MLDLCCSSYMRQLVKNALFAFYLNQFLYSRAPGSDYIYAFCGDFHASRFVFVVDVAAFPEPPEGPSPLENSRYSFPRGARGGRAASTVSEGCRKGPLLAGIQGLMTNGRWIHCAPRPSCRAVHQKSKAKLYRKTVSASHPPLYVQGGEGRQQDVYDLGNNPKLKSRKRCTIAVHSK